LKSEIKSSNGLVREIEIEVPAETVDKAFAEQYRKYQKEAKIKGVGKSYPEAVREHDLKVASPPDFPGIDIQEGSDFKYTAKIEVMPEIEKVDYSGIVLSKEEIDVRDTEVDAVVDHLRRKSAEFRTSESKQARKERSRSAIPRIFRIRLWPANRSSTCARSRK